MQGVCHGKKKYILEKEVLMDHYTRILSLKNLIGNTPILEINYKYKGKLRKIYAKAENFNMTGSIKDRMAFHILKTAIEAGYLKKDARIIEATSGNTGISFAAIGRAIGHNVTIFMPDWMSEERKNLIRAFGADIELVSREQGGFLGSIKMAEELAESLESSFLPRQFSNDDNIMAHYNTTANELWWQLAYRDIVPNAFIAGVGTGGTIMGVAKFLKEKNPEITVHPLEPANSPTLTTGYKVGKHRIQGISDEFIPSIVKLDQLDDIVAVDDGDSIIMAQKIVSNLGIGVGISSGANFVGAVMKQEELGGGATVVTVFPDSNKKYLSTDLLREEPIKEGFISPDIELLNFKAIKRVCHSCCDPIDCKEGIYNDHRMEIKLPTCIRRGC